MSYTLTSGAWNHEQEGQTTSVDQLVVRAVMFAGERSLGLSPSKCSRLVRAHIRKGGTIATAAELLGYCMTHADPTGESAAHNVDTFDRRGYDARAVRQAGLSRGQIIGVTAGGR